MQTPNREAAASKLKYKDFLGVCMNKPDYKELQFEGYFHFRL